MGYYLVVTYAPGILCEISNWIFKTNFVVIFKINKFEKKITMMNRKGASTSPCSTPAVKAIGSDTFPRR